MKNANEKALVGLFGVLPVFMGPPGGH